MALIFYLLRQFFDRSIQPSDQGNPCSPLRSPSEKLFRRLQSFRFDTCNSGSILARCGCSGWGSRATSARNKMHGVEGNPSSPQRSPSLQAFRFSLPEALESFHCLIFCRTHQTFRFSLKGARASLYPPPHHFLGIDTSQTADRTRTNTIPNGTKANAAGLSGLRAIAQKRPKREKMRGRWWGRALC